jgi:CheY-like chemotaxis protein
MSSESGGRILVVDDERAVRELVVRALREAGYEVVAVSDGLAALEAAKTRRPHMTW